jgi:antitoxin CcdA
MRSTAQAGPEKAARKPTNLSLDAHLVDQARRLGINLSRACEQGLAAQIAEERARRWRADNAEAIVASNHFVEKNGLPLGALRRF